MVISSRNNEKIKRIVSLKEKKYRNEENAFLVEGFKMVKEAFSYGMEIKTVIGTESGLNRLSADFGVCADEVAGEVLTVIESVFERVTDSITPQGVAAVISKNKGVSVGGGISVLLDGVADPGNMGTIIRTLAALGVKKAYLVDCCDPYSPKAVRASMSGIYSVDAAECDLKSALKELSKTPIFVADMGGENVFNFNPPENYCVVIGNEANGVRAEIKEIADKTIAIPMQSRTESLNAAVSLAVILYELKMGK